MAELHYEVMRCRWLLAIGGIAAGFKGCIANPTPWGYVVLSLSYVRARLMCTALSSRVSSGAVRDGATKSDNFIEL